MPTIRAATTHDLPAVGRALAAAFADDPVWEWLAPDRRRYERAAAGFFRADAAQVLSGHGELLVDDDVGGAALWAAPNRWKAPLAQTARLTVPALRLFGSRTWRGLGALTALEKAHPPGPPHWYLSVLGTDPRHQGRGIGSALLRAVTDRCDEEGLPAYLESSKESNVAFYARHGFEETEVLSLPGGGPSLWLMWREPR